MNILLGVAIIIGLVIMLIFIYCAMVLSKDNYKNKEFKDYIEDFLVELRHNQNTKNEINIDYVIERLEDIKNEKL